MSTIASLALAIRARTEQMKGDLKPGLDAIKDWGAKAVLAGGDAKEVGREMGRMRQEMLRGGEAGKASGETLAAGLRNAKVGAAALTGAISAMSSELGGTIGHATRLGTSLVSSFLAGGPVALGITAVAAGFSAIAGAANGAAAEVERVTKNTEKMRADSLKAIESLQEELARKQDELAVSRGSMDSTAAAENQVARTFAARKRAAEKGVASERENIKRWNDEARELGSGIVTVFDESEIEKRDVWIRQAQARIKALESEMEAARKVAILDRESINQKATATRHEAEEAARAEKAAVATAAKRAELEKRGSDAAQERVEALRAELKAVEDVNAAREESTRSAEAASRASLEAAGRTAAEARAAELQARVEAEEGVAAAAKEAAGAAQVKAVAEKEAVEAVREQTRLVSKRLDVTKQFRNTGGSLFGFGAGQAGTGLGDIGADAARARRAAGDLPGSGRAGGSGQAGTLPELAPHVKAMESEISKIPAWSQRLEQALVSASGTTKASILELGRSTERAVGALRRDQDETKAKVRSMAKAIERAGNGTGAGD